MKNISFFCALLSIAIWQPLESCDHAKRADGGIIYNIQKIQRHNLSTYSFWVIEAGSQELKKYRLVTDNAKVISDVSENKPKWLYYYVHSDLVRPIEIKPQAGFIFWAKRLEIHVRLPEDVIDGEEI